MNLSGDSVSPALAFYKLPPEHLIVVYDELDFELGDVRLKFEVVMEVIMAFVRS